MDKELSQGKGKRAEEESIEGASTSLFISPVLTGQGDDQYDVFLSFRGLDTRKKFTDHLYHRLVSAGTVPFSVFKDDNSIPIGEEFGSQILDAISRSKISIPIISKNYATSKWCLRELIHMIDRKNSMSHIVLPIFYEVKPSDVRYLKGSFGEAFRLSQACFEEKDIKEGRQALNEVSYLNGWESEKFADGHEGKLIERVVETVTSTLQKDFQLDVSKQLVGLEGHLEEIMNWIDSPSIHARMIGIYGMGGIGKTTLAKHIYNQLSNKFVHVSFLPDVGEITRRHGIMYLQSQLISDILHSKSQVSRIDDGINIIKSRFKGKKVLILLDDIDDKNQLHALAREQNWFMAGSMIIVTTRNAGVLDQSEFEGVYKYELNELDQKHALLLFKRHAFRTDHSSRDFERISHDIISTMGGLPLALEVVGSSLYKKTNQKVWEDVLKKLKSEPHRDVQKILRISYDALEDGHKQIFLDVACYLIGKNSIFATYMWEDDGLYPSEGIEELKSRCLIKIGDHGWFEMHDQLRDLGRSIFREEQRLDKRSGPWDNNYKGTAKILCYRGGRCWFHDLMGGASIGDSNELLSEVRWLQWEFWEDDPPLPTASLHLPNLSVLELSWCRFTEDWEGWRSSFMTAKRLQVLDLRCCYNLRCTPDLSAFTQLKILTFRTCRSLEHLHPSLGKLKSLVSLDLNGCWSLKELPREVGELKDLEELVLDESCITEIPTSIGSLRKLKKLSAVHCESLREIPSSIGDLQNLQHLDLSCSGIEKLPSAIGRLKNLRTLRLNTCPCLKRAIPSEIGDLSSLEILDMAWARISDLPESIRNLSSLQRLYTGLQSLPEQLPMGLTYLYVASQSPRSLNLSSLIHLEKLHLRACHLLEYIPELPSRLLKLHIENCGKLILLKLNGCEYLEKFSIKKCSSIERLDLSQLIHLKRLRVEDCNKLVEIQGNLEFLEDMSICRCNSIKRLLCVESRCLKELRIYMCNNLVEIRGLDGAKFLEKLDFGACESLETLPNLTRCEKLRSLNVYNCKKLTQLRGLEKLDSIDLNIFGCDSLEAIPELSGF
ncbi:disease resistance protein RPV1-like [Syzygium oleosum]|uniref:disease resistance protein RPV1-like n=1 Tax=Syzygium oleosum TaxID=219896 RepID=UPI0024BB54D4|nr:disease resistance protein RPV1-like [Syzygium oleosum]XP_056165507.1 disease resistance protein RPV1-like [Syzygium oleosum]